MLSFWALVAVELDVINVEFHSFFKKNLLRNRSYEYWALHCTELVISKIEFSEASLIEANYSYNSIPINSSFI